LIMVGPALGSLTRRSQDFGSAREEIKRDVDEAFERPPWRGGLPKPPEGSGGGAIGGSGGAFHTIPPRPLVYRLLATG
jgi:hypothetical protein